MGFHVHTNPQGASYCLLRPIWEPRDWSDSASPCLRKKLQLWITVKQYSHDWWVYPHHHICFKDPFCLLQWRCELTPLTMAGCILQDQSKVWELDEAFILCSHVTGKMGKRCYLTPRLLRSTVTPTSSNSLQTFCCQTSQLLTCLENCLWRSSASDLPCSLMLHTLVLTSKGA